MSEFLEIISEFRPKNGQKFAIADVNDLRGGYIQVETLEEMNTFLSTNKLKHGMLCYVKEVPDDGHMFIYRNGIWELWEGQGGSGGGGLSLVVVENLEELATKTALQMRGQIVYINSLDDLRFWNGQYWESFRKIYIQDTPPDDKGGIWIDTSEEGYQSSSDIIQNMLKVINILQQKVNRLMYMQTEIDPGDFSHNKSTSQDDLSSEEPYYGTSKEEDNETQEENSHTELYEAQEPDYLNAEHCPNTYCLKVKSGTQVYMKNHADDFEERELLWCYDTQTLWIKDPKTLQLIKIGATGGSDEPIDIETDMDGIIQETINNYKRITGIEFVDMANNNDLYVLGVKNGDLKLIDKSHSVLKTSQKVLSGGMYSPLYYPLSEHSSVESPFVYINMVYCGGDSDKYSYNPVSHSFIELCNISTQDLNLNGLYLHYSEGEVAVNGRQWVTLPLTGHIPAGRTFLIRCAPCSVYDSNTTLIKVGEPDMEWTYEATKNPEVLEIAATNETSAHSIWDENRLLKLGYSCSIYLSGGFEEAEQSDYSMGLTTPFDEHPFTSTQLFKDGSVVKYFIDLLGIGEGMECCTSYFNNRKSGLTPNNCLIFRYYNMDPVKQALKAPSALDNSKNVQWTYFNLAKLSPYINIDEYRPRNSKEGKNIFFNKAKLVEGPNVVNCSFGWDAHKTRCFNWISKGYYDEFIKIWPVGTDESEAQIFESFKEGDGRLDGPNENEHRHWDSPIYNRIRNVSTSGEDYTVHKFIHDFEEPEDTQVYNYKVGREGFWSDVHQFTMRNRDLVIQRGFQFVQTTDQQGFHDEEYKTWGITADFIKQDAENNPENAYEWQMNTGDQTQNGNRLNEWLAFYRDASNFYKNIEQMFTIGNNDLCSADPKVLGTGEDLNKVNPENINFFFTFEFPFDMPIVPGNEKYIPSVYSFIYGDTYFLCMNSEFTYTTQQDLYGVSNSYSVDGDATGPTGIYSIIKQWCINDLTYIDNKIKWKVAFTHDNPFTLLTRSQIYGTQSGGTVNYTYLGEDMQTENVAYSRGGSHLNSVGNYWFSKFLEDNNFRLCIGGHKHTYTCSRLMRDNPDNRMKPFVYDPDYYVENGETHYPDWYTNLGGDKAHLMQFGNLYDGQGNEQTYVKYVTLQATGYKTTSNKELPTANIPWLEAYYPAKGTAASTDRFASESKNGGQNYPHYILWRIGKGTEVTNPEGSTTLRDRILGRVYKTQPIALGDSGSGWTYTYNKPYKASDLKKIPGNGQNNPSNNIIVELSLHT